MKRVEGKVMRGPAILPFGLVRQQRGRRRRGASPSLLSAASLFFIFLSCFVLFLSPASPAFADDSGFSFLPLTGRVFADVYVPTVDATPDKPFQQLSLSTWVETAPHFSENTFLKGVLELDAFDAQFSYASDRSTVSHVETVMREAYFSTEKHGWRLRAGEMIIPWGKSDVFNPTDFNTAKNLSFYNPDDEVKRLGAAGIELSVTPNNGVSPWSSTTIVTPVPAEGFLLVPASLLPPGVTLANPVATPVELQNAEVAQKVSYNGTGWDASVSFFNGWNHQPQIQEINHQVVGPNLLVNLTQVYRRDIAYGADASLSTDKWVYRFESSYTMTPNDSGSNPLELPTHWDSVIGAERPMGDDFRVQVQLLLRYFPRYTAPSSVTGTDPTSTLVDQEIAAENALLNSYQDPSRPGGTIRVSYANEKTGWNGQIFFLQNFAGGDFLARPEVSYLLADGVRSTLGLEWYGGPTNRPLGALSSYTSVYFETKYTF